jgi:hypothetical protein
LARRYASKTVRIIVIGGDKAANDWVQQEVTKYPNLSFRHEAAIPREALMKRIAAADIGISVVRDENYEFGTKAFDYVACCVPIIDVFEPESDFRSYFSGCLDTDFDPGTVREKSQMFQRTQQFENHGSTLLKWCGLCADCSGSTADG